MFGRAFFSLALAAAGMLSGFGIAFSTISILTARTAEAADLPLIKASRDNAVPQCVTPGRLMAMTRDRNGKLDDRFGKIAMEYMRHGETLGVRWDYAYFQMLVETGNLSFRRGNGRWGDVKPAQNNFAGLGATGGGEPGERFADISSGVKAHLEHVLIYSGERIDNPTADRTRKVQEWGILTSWQKRLGGRVSFTDLTRKWSPGDRGYSRDIASVASRFFDDYCRKPDPHPEMVDELRGISVTSTKMVEAKGAEIARRAVAEARKETAPSAPPLALGAPLVDAGRGLTVLNAPKAEAPVDSKAASAPIKTAAAAGQAARSFAPPAMPQAKAPTGCKVWTASYGGQRSIIIKAVANGLVNYTVLDVNEGAEKREADAYIAAYARGGQTVGEYSSQNQALDKAFELCPEG